MSSSGRTMDSQSSQQAERGNRGNHRSTNTIRSLSPQTAPRKNRTVLTPVIQPFAKGLRKLRNVTSRSQSPGRVDTARTEEHSNASVNRTFWGKSNNHHKNSGVPRHPGSSSVPFDAEDDVVERLSQSFSAGVVEKRTSSSLQQTLAPPSMRKLEVPLSPSSRNNESDDDDDEEEEKSLELLDLTAAEPLDTFTQTMAYKKPHPDDDERGASAPNIALASSFRKKKGRRPQQTRDDSDIRNHRVPQPPQSQTIKVRRSRSKEAPERTTAHRSPGDNRRSHSADPDRGAQERGTTKIFRKGRKDEDTGKVVPRTPRKNEGESISTSRRSRGKTSENRQRSRSLVKSNEAERGYRSHSHEPTRQDGANTTNKSPKRRVKSSEHVDSAADTDQQEGKSVVQRRARRGNRRPSHEDDANERPDLPTASKPESDRSNGTTTRSKSDPKRGGNKPDSNRSNTSKPDSARSSSSGDSGKNQPVVSKRTNLDKRHLQHVQDLKTSIQQMRNQRRKAKSGTEGEAATGSALDSDAPSVGNEAASVTRASANATSTDVQSPTPQTSQLASTQQQDFNVSIGAISLDELEVGFLRQQGANAAARVPPEVELYRSDLENRLRSTKKLVKRTCRQVWQERDEITAVQRKSWSLRKALVNGEAPRDSVTTLNMRIEKLIRQEREIDLQLDQVEDEKIHLEQEPKELAKAIREFQDLMDVLNRDIVPLLPPEELYEAAEKAASAIKRRDDIELAESMHSMADEKEPSLSLSHLRMAPPE